MKKQEVIQLLDQSQQAMMQWIEAQPEDTFVVQKVPGKWSTGEHLEHLRKTTRAVNKGMKIPRLLLRYKIGINNRKERDYQGTKEKYRSKLKETGAKSPAQYTAENLTTADRERIIKWFKEEMSTLKQQVGKYSEARLSKYLLPHPLVGKMTFREFAIWTAVHTDHHFELMKRDNS